MGTLRWMPSTLALSAVHRQTAASRSTRPSRRLQHSDGCFGNLPTPTVIRPLSTLAQADSLSVSTGHLPTAGLGVGLGLGGVGHWLAAVSEKKRRLTAKKREAEAEALDAMDASTRLVAVFPGGCGGVSSDNLASIYRARKQSVQMLRREIDKVKHVDACVAFELATLGRDHGSQTASAVSSYLL